MCFRSQTNTHTVVRAHTYMRLFSLSTPKRNVNKKSAEHIETSTLTNQMKTA